MFTSVAALLAFSATVYGVAFDGPLPTPVDDHLIRADVNGWTPKPTNRPRSLPELFRRQDDEALCGYIDGDGDAPVSCITGGCFYNTAIDWFGCCTGTKLDSCKISTSCVASSAISSCAADSDCNNNSYVLSCTEASAPSCETMYSFASQHTVSHLVCRSRSTQLLVLPESTGGSSDASSLGLSSASESAASLTTTRSARPTSSASDDDDEETSVVIAATRSTTTDEPSTTARPTSAGPNVAASSSSTAGAAIQTAAAVVGAAGGLAGVIALLF